MESLIFKNIFFTVFGILTCDSVKQFCNFEIFDIIKIWEIFVNFLTPWLLVLGENILLTTYGENVDFYRNLKN